jgi:heme a synthase
MSPRFLNVFKLLIAMTVGLMALGAGVRAMHAGLSCPDWPLCFGKVIPDFHVGVYFEFIHRTYAGIVALLFFTCLILLLRNRGVPRSVKVLGLLALATLLTQIIMGGLTVLKLLRVSVVTSHLLLAAAFASLLLIMYSILTRASIAKPALKLPALVKWPFVIFPAVVFAQIWLGGLVATSYAGAACVDFPTCNGQWVPTWDGPIGLQVIHRFGAYTVALYAIALLVLVFVNRREKFVTGQLLAMSRMLLSVVALQICVGVANVLFFIPAWLTVLHQLMAMIILLTALRTAFIAREISR